MRHSDDDVKAALKRLPQVKSAAYKEMSNIMDAQAGRFVPNDVALVSRLMAAAAIVVAGSRDQFELMQQMAIAHNIFTSFIQELVEGQAQDVADAQDEADHATKQ